MKYRVTDKQIDRAAAEFLGVPFTWGTCEYIYRYRNCGEIIEEFWSRSSDPRWEDATDDETRIFLETVFSDGEKIWLVEIEGDSDGLQK